MKILIVFNKYPTKNCKTTHFTYINQALLFSILQDVRKAAKSQIITIYSLIPRQNSLNRIKNHEPILTKILIVFFNKYPTKNCKATHFTYINQALLFSVLQDVRKAAKSQIIAIYSLIPRNISECS